ncbi:unannotated protein [freshwater metagenome]|uniref:Unannotated protein n=1 Tax=freshwater metagenome TaxID=449393 RepID=A0A6J7HJC9_9ZZZZ
MCASTNAATCARDTEPSRHAAPITGTAPSQSPASNVRFTPAKDSFVRARNHADAVRNPASANVLPPATRAATSPLSASRRRVRSTMASSVSAISSSAAHARSSPLTEAAIRCTALSRATRDAVRLDRRPATSAATASSAAQLRVTVMVMKLQTSGMDTAHHAADAPAKTLRPRLHSPDALRARCLSTLTTQPNGCGQSRSSFSTRRIIAHTY